MSARQGCSPRRTSVGAPRARTKEYDARVAEVALRLACERPLLVVVGREPFPVGVLGGVTVSGVRAIRIRGT